MADNSGIEWTDATWNPITGCSVVSPGCTNCYAMGLAGTRLRNHPSRAGLTRDTKAGPVWTGEVRFNARWLDQPLHWRKPRMIFLGAHSDLFHPALPRAARDRIYAVMARAHWHTFQVLTKRADLMRAYLSDPELPRRIAALVTEAVGPDDIIVSREDELATGGMRHVWHGVSAERQREADERIHELRATPSAVRYVSLEPLLGPIDLRHLNRLDTVASDCLTGLRVRPRTGKAIDKEPWNPIDWVIAGGESGPHARPSHPDWFHSLRDQCQAAGVPFFFKQWGEWREFDTGSAEIDEVDAGTEEAEAILALAIRPGWIDAAGNLYRRQADLPADTPCRLIERAGKTLAGAKLNGREHREMPQ